MATSSIDVLDSKEFRQKAGIDFEAYDDELMKPVIRRFSDRHGGQWMPADLLDVIRQGAEIVYVLSHPRSWSRSPRSTLREDLHRGIEGVSHRFGRQLPKAERWHPTLRAALLPIDHVSRDGLMERPRLIRP